MAYTYDDFVSAAKNAGLYDTFGQEDLTAAQSSPEYGLSLLKLQQDAGKATTEEQKLLVQEAVNQLRNTYGVTIPSAGTQPSGSFAYGGETEYQKLLDRVSTPGSFQYDHRRDEGYKALREGWTADNDRTSGKLLTGAGVPTQSSWAGAAAQQSNNYYDTRLNDQIPTMHQNAYQEYLGNLGKDTSMLEAMSADRQFAMTADQQAKQLAQTRAQQEFDNALTLHKQFGTEAPVLPELGGITPGADESYSYGKQTEYQKALDAVTGQEDFRYDHRQDPLYGSLRKTGMREGDRAAADLLAQLNARTGGVASSYGVRAAGDAANAYNESLNGAVPGLRQNAYQEYLGDFEAKLQGLGALAGDRDVDYAGWLQRYQADQAAKQQQFQNALALYQAVGLTPEIAAVLGVPYEAPSGGYGGNGRPAKGQQAPVAAEDLLNALVAGRWNNQDLAATSGYDRGTVSGQGGVGSTLNSTINAALKAGAITQAEASRLKEIYTPRPHNIDDNGDIIYNTGRGGRYTY